MVSCQVEGLYKNEKKEKKNGLKKFNIIFHKMEQMINNSDNDIRRELVYINNVPCKWFSKDPNGMYS